MDLHPPPPLPVPMVQSYPSVAANKTTMNTSLINIFRVDACSENLITIVKKKRCVCVVFKKTHVKLST